MHKYIGLNLWTESGPSLRCNGFVNPSSKEGDVCIYSIQTRLKMAMAMMTHENHGEGNEMYIWYSPSWLRLHLDASKISWLRTLRCMENVWYPGASNSKADSSDKSVSSWLRVCHCERTTTVTLNRRFLPFLVTVDYDPWYHGQV